MIAKRNLLLPAFLLTLAVIYSGAFYIAGILPFEAHPEILAAAVTFDLTLFVPLLYYFLLVRGRRFPAFTLVPVFLASLLAASYIVPVEHHGMLNLVGWLTAPLEIIGVGFVVYKIYRFKKHFSAAPTNSDANITELIENAAREISGSNFIAKILAFELSMIYFALFSWRKKCAADCVTSFSYHKNSGYGAIVFGFIFLLVVETFVVHFLVARWSLAAAWILTALSAYGVLWLMGDHGAVKLRPIRILDDAVDFRLGLRWTMRIPFEAVESFGTAMPDNSNYLKAVIADEPGYFIQLKEAHDAEGFYGMKKSVKAIGFAVDESKAFADSLSSRFERWKKLQSENK